MSSQTSTAVEAESTVASMFNVHGYEKVKRLAHIADMALAALQQKPYYSLNDFDKEAYN